MNLQIKGPINLFRGIRSEQLICLEGERTESAIMVPLVASSSKKQDFEEDCPVRHFNSFGDMQDKQSSSLEEFATHLSLYDDHIHFVDRTAFVPSRVVEGEVEGPIPPSIFCPVSQKDDDVTEPVKVKRKCGRPRNPIPRHKRESHINAEHRRRGKIQNGFRTLKCLVPKYDQSSGRDSKADILFKAVDHCKLLQHDISELTLSMDAVKAEKEALGADIKNYQTLVPDPNVYKQLSTDMNQHLEEYIQQRNNEYTSFWAFTFILRPLFESYKNRVSGSSLDELLRSVCEWTENVLTAATLGDACMTLLREVGKDAQENRDQGSSVDSQVHRASDELPSKSGQHFLKSDVQSCSSNNAEPQTYSPAMTMYSQSLANGCSPPYATQVIARSPPYDTQVMARSPPYDTQVMARSPQYDIQVTARYTSSSVPFSPDHHSINAGDSLMVNPVISSGASDSLCSSLADDSRILSNPSPHLAINPSEILPFNSPYPEVHYGHEHDQQHGDHQGPTSSGLDFWQQPQSHLTSYVSPTQQHPSHHHHTDHIVPTTSNLFGVGKGHWSTPSYLSGELDNQPPMYYTHLSGGDTKHDSFTSLNNAHPMSPSHSSPEQEHRSHLTYEYHRQKSYSLSSTESEGSVLSIGSYTRPVAELFKDQDKYCQLSPSTDGCLSPGSNGQLDSPCAGIERAAQELSFHDGPIGLDHCNKTPSNSSYYNPCLTNGQLALSLPSYRDTFGSREQKNKPSIPTVDEVPQAANGSKRLKEGSIWQKIRKMGSSSLLAELLAPTKQFGSALSTSRPGDPTKVYPVSENSSISLSSNSHQTLSDNRPQTSQSIHLFWDNPSDSSFQQFAIHSSKSSTSKPTKSSVASYNEKLQEQLKTPPGHSVVSHYTETETHNYTASFLAENHRHRKDDLLLFSQHTMAACQQDLQNCEPSLDESTPNYGFQGYNPTPSILRSAIFDGSNEMSSHTKDGQVSTLNRKLSYEDSFPDDHDQVQMGAFKRVCYWSADLHGGDGHVPSSNCGVEISLPRSDNSDRKPVESQG